MKKICYVRINDTKVENSDYMFHIDLGSCVSVVLCGKDNNGTIWIGSNHLFKSRDKDHDLALKHVAELYNKLRDKNVGQIYCLGVFGAGYKENSSARVVARKNIKNILEALSLYKLNIEIFETGYSQAVSILKSDSRESFIIKHHDLDNREIQIIEIPLSKIFG
ncbi:MAG: hypothetical protein GY754_43870 [bacterium]|nr:hypothetical protein [bacterium]